LFYAALEIKFCFTIYFLGFEGGLLPLPLPEGFPVVLGPLSGFVV
jgi:hypothetical protein